MQQQITAGAKYKAEGVELLRDGKLQPALFKFHLVRLNTCQTAQERLVTLGLGRSPYGQSLLPTSGPGSAEGDASGGMGAAMLGGQGNKPAPEELAKEALALYVASANNAALIHLKLGRWEAAAASATEVLHAEPDNAKALYRRGLARLQRGDLDGAAADLVAAQRCAPEDVLIQQQLEELREKQRQHTARERAAMSKMFSSDEA
jgi:tetratricopeptide (TPR) repeat protein